MWPNWASEAETGSRLSFVSTLKHQNPIVSNSQPLVIRNTGACCRFATRWSTGLWTTGMTWREFGSMFTPKSNCRRSQRRWASFIRPHDVGIRRYSLFDQHYSYEPFFSCGSIPCCWLKRRWTPARTGKRLLRFSLRPSTFLLSSSPCRLS